MKEKLKALIGAGDIKQVIAQLKKLTIESSNKALEDEVLAQESKFNIFKQESRAGMLSNESKNQIQAKIIQALIEIIEILFEGNDSKSDSTEKSAGTEAPSSSVSIGEISGGNVNFVFNQIQKKKSPPKT